MSTTESDTKTVSETDRATITRHHEDPSLVDNATTYFRCSDCKREAIREQDLRRPEAHAQGCSAR